MEKLKKSVTKKVKKKSKVKTVGYHNLNNEEVIFVYLQNRIFYDAYTQIINDGGMKKIYSSSLFGNQPVFHKLEKEEIEAIKKEKRYLFIKSINDKLSPIIELIKPVMEKEYTKLSKIIHRDD
jgi:hypothetical protein